MAFRDRLFVTAGVRSDRNSAFGANFKTVFYPKVAVSWVASDEDVLPEVQLAEPAPPAHGVRRVRRAAGHDRRRAVLLVVDHRESRAAMHPAVVFSTLGNRNLKPERSTELELGVDGTFWNSRLSTEFTYYNKSSRDALISRGLPPSTRHRRHVAPGEPGRGEQQGLGGADHGAAHPARRLRVGRDAQRLAATRTRSSASAACRHRRRLHAAAARGLPAVRLVGERRCRATTTRTTTASSR